MKNLSKKSKRMKKNKTQKYIARGGTVQNLQQINQQNLQQINQQMLQKSNATINSATINNSTINNATNIAKGYAVNTLDNVGKNLSNTVGNYKNAVGNFGNTINSLGTAVGAVNGAIGSIGNTIDFYIKNPNILNQTLENIKQMVTKPEYIQKTTDIINGIAKNSEVFLKAADPIIIPLTDKINEVTSKAAEKVGETATIIASNFVKEIPGVGLAYTAVQDVAKVGEAVSAATNATAEITTSISDGAIQFKRNLEKLQNEKINILNRTTQSLNQFHGGSNFVNSKTRKVRFVN